MKSFIRYILIFGLFLTTVTNIWAKSPWKQIGDVTDVHNWKLTTHKKTYISKSIRMMDPQKIMEALQNNKYQNDLNSEKSKMLNFVGVSDWTVTSSRWTEINGKKVMEVKGTYTDSLNEKVSFIENHVFGTDKIIRFLYIKPEKAAIKEEYYRDFLQEQVKKI